MQVKNEAQSGLTGEVKIPLWAWTLAAIGFVAAQFIFNALMEGPGAPPAWARVLLGIVSGTIVGVDFLLLGYVNRDARRRGMSALLWTVVAILIPNGLGFLLYFILRQPLRRTCPQCGNLAQMGFNFCPRCSCKLSASCPNCQRAVAVNDVYCPHCGTSLRNQAVADYAAHP